MRHLVPFDWDLRGHLEDRVLHGGTLFRVNAAVRVLLAMGFLKPEHPQFAENVFVAGDAASGASLVVRAIASGRKAATDIDSYLNK